LLNAPFATILAALIAFVGMVLGLIVAYRRWVRERESARFARFETDQQDIYKSLWEKVEDVNVSLRRMRVDDSGFL
jgi:membrane protein implicated in regulation of membrane protease activity